VSPSRARPTRDPAAELRTLLPGPTKLTLAVAESMTCGCVQAAIGALSGASEYFLGGITTYTLEEKVRHLEVDRAVAEQANSVSAEIAAAMARGACRLFRSDLAVATTGYAEPNPARGFEHPVAFWAVARSGSGNVTVVRHGFFEGHGLKRIDMQRAVADEVLAALVDYVRLFRASEQQSKFV
jgi:nicotinamide-nucleotide amidase